MSETDLNLSRRKFMVASSAAIAAPILMNMAGMVPDAKGAEKTYDFIDKKSCDVVVLGGGGSGLVAAVRAAQLTGKKVIVLEKDSAAGGCARYATGVRTFGSKWQAKRNIADTTTDYAREIMDELYWRLDEKLVSNLLRGTGQFFDWICEQGGDIEDLFDARNILGGPAAPDMNQQKSGKKMGLFVMDMMKEKCPKYGVEILTKHPVVDVEVKNGKIVAAVAKSEKGYVRVACNACIMSIGSWINNEEVVKKYYPKFAGMTKYMDASPHWGPNLTGDGIALAEKVGAFLDYDSFVMRLMGPMHGMGMRSKVFSAMASSPYIITVNLDGKRYCSEPVNHMGEFDGGQVQLEQPHGMSYDIFDQNTIAAALKKQKSTQTTQGADQKMMMGGAAGGMPGGAAGGASGVAAGGAVGAAVGAQAGGTAGSGAPSGGMPSGGGPGGGSSSLPNTVEEIASDLKEALAQSNKSNFKADTLEELADKIGVNKKNFLETVKDYNEGCEKGVDWEFYKSKDTLVPINKPPYYAALGTLGTDGAFGGVLVNPEIQAYKPDRSLVEGLYVTGDFASGRHVNMGDVKHQVINDLSWAFTSGFLAGTNAGKYLKSLG